MLWLVERSQHWRRVSSEPDTTRSPSTVKHTALTGLAKTKSNVRREEKKKNSTQTHTQRHTHGNKT